MYKKVLFLVILSIFTSSVFADDKTEVECSTVDEFSKYDCQQCFDGGEVKEGTSLMNLTDIWSNNSDNDMAMNISDQKDPVFHALNGAEANQEPKKDFWEYTYELRKLKNENGNYFLPSKQKVEWIKSSDLASIKFSKVPEKGGVAGVIVYDLKSRNLLEDGTLTEPKNHRECIAYSSEEKEISPAPVEPKKEIPLPPELPRTGAFDYYCLAGAIIFLLGLTIYITRRKK